MKLTIKDPTTHELKELQRLKKYIKEKHNATFSATFETEGYVFCYGDLVDHKGSTMTHSCAFMPIGNTLGNGIGKARVLSEILCLVQCLEQIGDIVEWMDEDEKEAPVKVNPSLYSLTEEYIKGASSFAEAMRRVRDSGYPNYLQMEEYLNGFKNSNGNRKRATKFDVIDYVFSNAAIEPTKPIAEQKRDSKPVRSGAEWSRVKKLAQKNLPIGYNSADEFANFASKSEVDELELQNNTNNE